jgi:hypothetical protein
VKSYSLIVKTVSVSIDDATWQAASEAAAVQNTTLDMLVSGFLKDVAASTQNGGDAERRAHARKELVKALRECNAVVGEKPTRERTYSDRRFHRH